MGRAHRIGLVSAEPARLVTGIGDTFGLKPYLGNSLFVGDEYGLFVLPLEGRLWIPESRRLRGGGDNPRAREKRVPCAAIAISDSRGGLTKVMP
jgi:hypothetical protein